MKKKIFAISGSTRKGSSNLLLIKAIAKLFEEDMDITIFEGLADLPHFNPDIDNAAPATVLAFRRAIREADGVLISTPEYAHGVPGSLKNAIDWTVSTADFSKRPTALITASTDGRYGHNALLETLKVIEAENIDGLQLVIQFIRTRLSPDSTFTDEVTLNAVRQLMLDLLTTINSCGS